jgi:hypothetical protein
MFRAKVPKPTPFAAAGASKVVVPPSGARRTCAPGPACADGHEQEKIAFVEKTASVDLV